jgi:hypothetical protein
MDVNIFFNSDKTNVWANALKMLDCVIDLLCIILIQRQV